MERGYYKGEFVYVFEGLHYLIKQRIPGTDEWDFDAERRNVQVIKHRDLIKMLNKLFKTIAETEEKKGYSEIESRFYHVISTFNGFCSSDALPYELVNKKGFAFDDETKVKRAMPRLSAGTGKRENMGALKIVKGGLYEKPRSENSENYDILSDIGKAFMKKQANDQHKDA